KTSRPMVRTCYSRRSRRTFGRNLRVRHEHAIHIVSGDPVALGNGARRLALAHPVDDELPRLIDDLIEGRRPRHPLSFENHDDLTLELTFAQLGEDLGDPAPHDLLVELR